ncbi:MAG TPA: branched-chain amino acid ABC transporter substrate-binding protein [Solirubrobacterales bacterium]
MRVPATAAVALVVFAFAGCSSGDYDDQAPDDATLTVYVGAPLRGESGEEGRAIVNGAKLALEDAGGEAGGVDVEPVYMDDTAGEGARARWDPVVVADNARRAAQDSTAIAYIGDLESGATRISLPITNQAQMLQVSAASTAVDLTRESSASDAVPQLTQPTGERTFGRVIPDDEKQAGAGAAWADELGFASATVETDRSDFGEVVGDEFTEEAEALGIAIESGGELTYLAGESGSTSEPGADSMGTDALFDTAQAGYLTSSAQAPEQLPPAGRDFARAYEEAFGEPPDRYAAYGYEAMAIVLDSIERAEDPRDRTAVIDEFFATSDRDSVLGTYSIDEAGDTTLDAIAGYRVEDGEPRFDSALRAP